MICVAKLNLFIVIINNSKTDFLNDNILFNLETLPAEILCETFNKLPFWKVLTLRLVSNILRFVIDKHYLNHLFATERLITLDLKNFVSTSTIDN